MKQHHKIIAATTALLSLALVVSGESNDKYSLKGKHQFTITAGSMWDGEYVDNQEIGSFDYSYWMSEYTAISVSLGGITDEDNHSGFNHHGHHHDHDLDDSVGFVHLGVQVRPDFFNFSDRVYLTLQGQFGPYVGVDEYTAYYEDDPYDHWHETDEETKWGAYLGVNLNVALSNHFIVGASVGKHFVEEFEYAINDEFDYSRPDARFRFSFLF